MQSPESAPSARGLLHDVQDALTCFEPLVLLNVQNCEKERKNMQTAAEGGRHRTARPRRTSSEAAGRPTPPPSPSRRPLLPRALLPRSAGLSASGRPCAAA